MPRLNVRPIASWDALAALLRDWARALAPVRFEALVTAATVSRSGSAVLADDATLTFHVAANQVYALRGVIYFDTVAAADFQWALACPAGTVRIASRAIAPGATALSNIVVQTAAGVANAILSTSGTGGVLWLDAHIVPSAEGNVTFRWAQNTSDAGATSVLAGSWLELTRP